MAADPLLDVIGSPPSPLRPPHESADAALEVAVTGVPGLSSTGIVLI